MSASTITTNFAGRVGAWSASHRRTAIAGWLAFMVLAVLAGTAIRHERLTGATRRSGESARAQKILDRAGMPETRPTSRC